MRDGVERSCGFPDLGASEEGEADEAADFQLPVFAEGNFRLVDLSVLGIENATAAPFGIRCGLHVPDNDHALDRLSGLIARTIVAERVGPPVAMEDFKDLSLERAGLIQVQADDGFCFTRRVINGAPVPNNRGSSFKVHAGKNETDDQKGQDAHETHGVMKAKPDMTVNAGLREFSRENGLPISDQGKEILVKLESKDPV